PRPAGLRDGPARDGDERAARRGDRALPGADRAAGHPRRRRLRGRPAGAAAAMTGVWVTIGLLTVGTVAIKAVGPVVLGGRDLPPRLNGVVARLAPALLAALVVVETFGRGHEL